MKKRIMSLVLAACMILSLLPTGAFAAERAGANSGSSKSAAADAGNPFTDIRESDWYYEAVQYVFANGFFSGIDPDTFLPDGTMTRGMFLTVLGRMAGVDTSSYAGESAFSDVKDGAYYAPYVAWAAKHEITFGTGNKVFSPDAKIDRAQMATLFVRYFDVFNVNYETGKNITGLPADYDTIPEYARDAVLKLWKNGLLNGSNGNFDPFADANRAQAAALCERTDKAVGTWYREPGVPSDRVSVDPDTTSPSNSGTGGGTSGGGTSGGGISGGSSTSCKVVFHSGNAVETKDYEAGTLLSSLPTPYQENKVFLGWCYDSGLKQTAESGEKLSGDVDLYAKYGDVNSLSEDNTPHYIGKEDVAAGFTVTVKASGKTAVEVKAAITLKNLTNPTLTDGTAVVGAETLSVTGGGGTFTMGCSGGSFSAGSAYQLILNDDALTFAGADASVRQCNFTVAAAPVKNVQMSNTVKYLSASELSGSDAEKVMAYTGLYTVSYDADNNPTYTPTNASGSFSYNGSMEIAVGDTLAVYRGTRPDERKLNVDGKTDNGDVAYLEITAKDGTTYFYGTADAKNVLFTPDILPIDTDGDDDGIVSNENGTLVIDSDKLDFSEGYEASGLSAETTVDAGDYLAFYTGTYGGTAQKAGYGRITSVSAGSNNTTTITYTAAEESAVLSSMDLYDKDKLSDEEIEAALDEKQVQKQVKEQILNSGLISQMAEILAPATLETQEVQNTLGRNLTLDDCTVTYPDGSPVMCSLMASGDGNAAHKELGENAEVNVKVTPKLVHFEGTGEGVRVEVSISYKFDIQKKGNSNKIEVELTACLEQEVLFGVNVHGEAIWKKAWIFPYIYDYQLSGNVGFSTYTAFGLTAEAKLSADEAPTGMEWPASDGEATLTNKITNLTGSLQKAMKATNKVFPDVTWDKNKGFDSDDKSSSGSLMDKYADLIEDAGNEWVDLVDVPLIAYEGQADLFHILAFGCDVDFVVSADLHVAMGVTVQYEKKLMDTFSFMLWHKKAETNSSAMDSQNFEFDFYVMGTIGIRAGVRVKLTMGLFSTSLDAVGVQLESGLYIQLWGYFSYHLEGSDNGDGWSYASNSSGALLIEIGGYFEANFVAEVLGGKYGWTPSICAYQWPFCHVGEAKNVQDFAYEQTDEKTSVGLVRETTKQLPADLMDMAYFDLTTGEADTGSYDSDERVSEDTASDKYDDEKNFIVELSDPAHFSYDPTTDTITVTPGALDVNLLCKMTLTWKGQTLAFNSKSLSRVVNIGWKDLTGANCIFFNSTGGSAVETIYGKEGAAVTWPADPTRTGYVFGGWYSDSTASSSAYNGSTSVMGNSNLQLYARWIPAGNRITVEQYQQSLTGSYELKETATDSSVKTLDAVSPETYKKSYTGFTYEPDKTVISSDTVLADGTTLVKLYYDRNSYGVTFSSGTLNEAPIFSQHKYGETVPVPQMAAEGYSLNSWTVTAGGIVLDKNGTFSMPANAVTLTAVWDPGTDTRYRVEYYTQKPDGSAYTYSNMKSFTGTTGSTVRISADDKEMIPARDGLRFGHARVGTDDKASSAVIQADGSLVIRVYYDRSAYTVTYDTRGGSEIASVDAEAGAKLTAPADPTKPGYRFGGWYRDEAFTVLWDFDTDTVSSSLTLYANWVTGSGTPYKVVHIRQSLDGSYATEGDTVSSSTSYGTTGASVTPGVKSYSGFTAPEKQTVTIAADGTTVVTYRYPRKRYTVTWKNADSTPLATSTVLYGAEITAPEGKTPLRAGYTFTAWKPLGTMGAADRTIYASSLTADWTANTYNVTFDLYYTGAAAPVTIAQTFGSAYTLPVSTFTSRSDYQFIGWFTNPTSGKQVTAQTTLANPQAHTLYAHWTGGANVAYTVRHYQQDVSDDNYELTDTETKYGAVGSQTEAAAKVYGVGDVKYSYLGLTAKAFVQQSIAADGSTVVSIYYDRNTYTVTLDPNNGDAIQVYKNVRYGVRNTSLWQGPAPVKEGYRFMGWGRSENTKPFDDCTYTAAWEQEEYTVTYNCYPNDDHFYLFATVSGAVEKYHFGDTVTVRAQCAETGYTYTPWVCDSKNVTITDGTFTMPAGKVVLGTTKTENRYTVTLDSMGGTCSQSTDEVYFNWSYHLPTPVRPGYSFVGWFTAAEGGTQVTSDTTVTTAADHTLYAHWTPNDIAIGYAGLESSSIGADDSRLPKSYTAEGKSLTLPGLTKVHYSFTGWTCSNSGVTISKAEGAENYSVTIPAGTTDALTFTAEWKGDSCTITQYNAAGTQIIGTAQADYGSIYTLPFTCTSGGETNLVSRWTDAANGPTACGGEFEVTSNRNIYAVPYDAASAPVQIYTAGQMRAISSSEKALAAKLVLQNDVTLTDWTSGIGTFSGSFDGGGHTITFGGNSTRGLFALVSGGTVKNVVTAGSIGADGTGADAVNLGVIAGFSTNSSTISDCTNKTAVAFVQTDMNNNVMQTKTIGGIVGYAVGGKITDCTNAGTITTNDEAHQSPLVNIGGIAGQADGTSIKKCSNTAAVSVLITVSTRNDKDVCVGGIVGYACRGTSVTADAAGGTSNTAAVKAVLLGSIIRKAYAGGIAGYMTATASGAGIANASNSGLISGVYDSPASMGYEYLGGIAGHIENVTVDSCSSSVACAVAGESKTTFYSCVIAGAFCGSSSGCTWTSCTNSSEQAASDVQLLRQEQRR